MKNGEKIKLNSRKLKVSSLGRVQLPNGLISRGSLDAGYLRVAREKYRVHRLVALAFCPKEEGNNYHAVRLGLRDKMYLRPVKQIFDDGSLREFPSIAEARRATGIRNIGRACQGFQRHAGGGSTQKGNNYHAVRLGLRDKMYLRPVKQIFDDGSLREFPSIAEARRATGIRNIGRACQGFQRHAGGGVSLGICYAIIFACFSIQSH
ncbi:hypothetical protein Glove_348g41 [Diversispora epigaea]|uniref:Uncharacterized protein n=1 Tax=Diversispora epigaea TaxID=1348612 RepID=A0A397HLR9_9GLOM|nr:hypothetical protein Glove_348g41 [Diversispora epigaea]